ncbi:MAG: aldo/keto reductase [Cyclobacteriaceae bacterium]|jgi:aryl-alcohol dehydrogenase-like predicted oxidoreductase
MELKELSKIGFGAYRVSVDNQSHFDAVTTALKAGCNLIDTASNYGQGKSEKLIGKVIADLENRPFVITKAGYLDKSELDSFSQVMDEITILDSNIIHSINRNIIKYKIDRSLERLQSRKLDAFLLHNPEYYLRSLGSSKKIFYDRIRSSFEFLEELASSGVISYYGISSNSFIKRRDESDFVSLEKIIEIAKALTPSNHFKFIQFPLNIFETGALDSNYGDLNLIELARSENIKTIINRPLMAFYNKFPFKLVNKKISNESVLRFSNSFYEFENSLGQDKRGEEIRKSDAFGVLKETWSTIKSEAIASSIMDKNLGTLMNLTFNGDIPLDVTTAWFNLRRGVEINIQARINDRSNRIKADLFGTDSSESLQILCCKKYLTWNIDHILLGMRKVEYVEEFKTLFNN